LSIHTKHGPGVHRDRPRRVTHPNSLHTNAYDEAITTSTEESVRRAMAIRLIINREWGLAKNENPNQGAFSIGVNTFRKPHDGGVPQKIELIRSTEEEKQSQLKRLRDFKARHQDQSGPMLARLQQAVIANQNVFEVLVDAVRCCSLGQITNAMFEVGGHYRRSM
jgi:isobutyryl-CoA mutase